MAYLDDLKTRRDAVAAEIAAISSTKPGGLPDSGTGGVQHRAYKDGLYEELARLESLIQRAQDDSDGICEVETRGEAIW